MLKPSLRADQSTTMAIGAPQFRKTSASFGPRQGTYTGPGYVTQKYPVYPQRPLQPWQTNTSLELSQIVYPDGTLRNSSAAQEKVASEKEQALVEARIQDLKSKIPVARTARDRQDLQSQINELESKYFPARQRHAQAAAQHGEVLDEFKAGQVGLNDVRVSVEGHARAAELQRQGILAELRSLVAQGLVSSSPSALGGGTPAGSTPTGGLFTGGPPPMASSSTFSVPRGLFGSGASMSLPSAAPSLSSSFSLSPPTPAPSSLASATLGSSQPLSATTGTPAGSTPAASAPTAPSFKEEEEVAKNISRITGATYETMDDVISVLASGMLDRAGESELRLVAKNALTSLSIAGKSSKGLINTYIQLELTAAGIDPAEYVNVKTGNLKDLTKISGVVKAYAARRT